MSENGLLMEQLDKLNSDTVQTHFVLSLSFFFFCSAILNAEIHSDIRSQHFTISTVNELRDDSGF